MTSPDGKAEKHELTAADPTYAQDLRRETIAGELADAYGTNAMSVGEDYAKKHHVKVGDGLTVALQGRPRRRSSRSPPSPDDDVAIDQGALYTSIATVRQVPAGGQDARRTRSCSPRPRTARRSRRTRR